MIEARYSNGVCVLLLKNELMKEAQYANIQQIEKMMGENFGCPEMEGTPSIIVDLRELDFIQSSAIGVLLILRKKIKKLGGDSVLINVKESIEEALELAGLLDFFYIFNSEEKAVDYFKNK